MYIRFRKYKRSFLPIFLCKINCYDQKIMSYYENIRGMCNRNRFDLRMATNFICVYGLSTIDAFVRNICDWSERWHLRYKICPKMVCIVFGRWGTSANGEWIREWNLYVMTIVILKGQWFNGVINFDTEQNPLKISPIWSLQHQMRYLEIDAS